MKIDKVKQINEIIEALKRSGSRFSYDLTKALVNDYYVTNKFISEHQLRTNAIMYNNTIISDGMLTLNEENQDKFKNELKALDETDYDLTKEGLIPVTDRLIGNTELDITTYELLNHLISLCK